MSLLDALTKIHSILNLTVPVILLLGIAYFVWGVVQYVIGNSEEAKKSGRTRIIYGIVGLAIIVSVWGIVGILANTFGINDVTAPTVLSAGGCNTSAGIFGGGKKSFASVAGYITCTIKYSVIPFMFAVALLIFIWGIVKFFIVDADEEAKRSQGKQFMIWGLIALTVMISVWGLARIFGSTLGFNTSIIPQTKTE